MLQQRLARIYLTADPRSLGVGRIALGLVLLLDLAQRLPHLTTWYTNVGLMPNHTLLWQPVYKWVFSFFYLASWPGEAALGFAACALAYLALLLGYRTRLAHFLSFLCVLSLHGRVLFTQNGGDVVLGELCFWTMFLPTGRRYSIDSLRARLGAYQERDAGQLENRSAHAPDTAAVVSLAVLGLLLQLGLIYALNVMHKTGVTWREGSAVHYVLHQDRIVTALGMWVREWLSPAASKLLTWPALAMECALALSLLSPLATRWARRATIVLMLALHCGFALFLNLGVFVPAMIAFAPNLIPAADWDALESWRRRRPHQRRLVIFDGGCGVCFQIVRILARLDLLGRLHFVPNDDRERVPSDLDPELLDRTAVVVDPQSGRRWLRADAIAEVAAALPFGLPLSWLLRAPGLRTPARHAYDAFATRRSRISSFLGYAACAVPRAHLSASAGGSDERAGHVAGQSWPARAREATVALAMLLMASQALEENVALGSMRRLVYPSVAEAAASYLQFWQGWRMFAPDAPRTDMHMFVKAVTVDGRHLDPWNEAANPRHPDPGPQIPARLGQDAAFCNYDSRLPWAHAYHQAFREWVLRYPKRTKDPRDEIVSFEAFVVEDDSPPPGETRSRNTRIHRFLKHPD